MRIKKTACYFALFLPVLLATTAVAGQTGNSKSEQGDTPGASAPAPTPSPAPGGASPELTEREKLLLDRIEKLERRLSELESREATTAPNPAPAASPAVTTAAAHSTDLTASPGKAAAIAALSATPGDATGTLAS
ncbi:MAG TPA: hypothetical protein VI756_32980, partial [Blastocatellia bacterium]